MLEPLPFFTRHLPRETRKYDTLTAAGTTQPRPQNWKNARSADKGFQKQESLKFYYTAIQRLVEILKTTKDVFTTLKNNLTEIQCENRACFVKYFVCLRYLAWQRLPF